jgi:hypothetical protein
MCYTIIGMRSGLSAIKNSSRGQGTLEFVLILVITVGIVLLVSERLVKPSGELAKVMMGEYLGCLLDKGVLPKLNSEDDSCADSFKLSANNPYSKSSGGGSGKPNGGSKDGAQKKPSEVQEMSDSRSGSAGGPRIVGSRSGSRFTSSKGADNGSSGESKASQVPVPLAESKFYKVTNIGSTSYSYGKVLRVTGLTGLLAAEREKIKKREAKISKAGAMESGDDRSQNKKMVVKAPTRKVAEEEQAQPMTFGKLFRIFLILIIIVAIVVFIGGQAMQISKSWEK